MHMKFARYNQLFSHKFIIIIINYMLYMFIYMFILTIWD